MAYVREGMNDVFISYAHVDNVPLTGIEHGWVNYFVDTFKKLFETHTGRPNLLKLWVDKQSNDLRLIDDIPEQVKKSNLFLMILSSGYLESKYCQTEMECFLKKLKEDSRKKKQIFIVEKNRVSPPKALNSIISYRFWYEDVNNRVRTRGLPTFNPNDTDYYFTVEDIVYDMISVMDELKRKFDESESDEL